MQRVLPFFEARREQGVRRQDLSKFIKEVTEPVGSSMIPRRVSTIVSWLTEIGMVEEKSGRYFLRQQLPAGLKILEYEASDEPLFPTKYDLDEYEGIAGSVRGARGTLTVLIDDAAKERAEAVHQKLTALVAEKIRAAGAIPKSNRYVDLSAALRGDIFLFEMKSTTAGNLHGQVRKAISQLYEYRYLQQLSSAKLVVVIENKPPREKWWLVDYIVRDRQLLIAWDGDGDILHCPAGISAELNFLA